MQANISARRYIKDFMRSFEKIFALILLMVTSAVALPIQPTAQDLLKQVRKPESYPVARVAWSRTPVLTISQSRFPTLDRVLARNSPQHVRAELMQALTPDWRLFALLGCAIFLMRTLRNRNVNSAVKAPVLQMPGRASTPASRAA